MKVEKTCVVCGKSFLATNPLYCICSDECRHKRNAVYNKRYRETHVEETKKQRKRYYEKYQEQHKKKSYCKICGALLPNGMQKYCLDCLLNAYQNTETHSWAIGVLCCRGYDKEAVLSEIEERRKNDRP